MADKHVMGIDPGAHGCAVVLNGETGAFIEECRFSKVTLYQMAEFFAKYPLKNSLLEKVHSMPGQGVRSTFTFGQNYGRLEGILTSQEIRFEYVTPQKWMSALKLKVPTGKDNSKARKNALKAAAQRLFPKVRVVLDNADALLIAEACYRWTHGMAQL